ncbi:MAG TPA: hypothetical protein VGM92_13795, partial [Candidatus Kapabacteria bacterium]
IPASAVTTLHFDNAQEIKSVTQPLFLCAGIGDSFLNITTNGDVVFANYRGTYSEEHRIPGADHSTVPQTWGLQNYSDSILKFLTRP